MQPHDPEHPVTGPLLSENPYRSEFPDEISRTESGPVSTDFASNTGRRTKTRVGIAAGVLMICFLIAISVRLFHANAVAKAGETAYSTAPPVDVVIARAATMGQDLVLPGETAAWYETTIYARVNGYVANWLVDIGDHVKKGPGACDASRRRSSMPSCRLLEHSSRPRRLRSRRARRRPNSARPPTSAGATRPRGWCPSRSANRRKQTTKARRRACMRPMRRSISTNPRWINTAPWRNSNW